MAVLQKSLIKIHLMGKLTCTEAKIDPLNDIILLLLLLVFSTQIHLTMVTSISIISHLVAFLSIASGHFVVIYTRKHVVTTQIHKKTSITCFS